MNKTLEKHLGSDRTIFFLIRKFIRYWKSPSQAHVSGTSSLVVQSVLLSSSAWMCWPPVKIREKKSRNTGCGRGRALVRTLSVRVTLVYTIAFNCVCVCLYTEDVMRREVMRGLCGRMAGEEQWESTSI